MKSIGLTFSSFLFLFVSAFLMVKVYPAEFIDAHIFTFMVLIVSLGMAFSSIVCVAAEDKAPPFGMAGAVYFVLMDVCMFLHQWVEEQTVIGVWSVMLGAACLTIVAYRLFEPMYQEKTKKEVESDFTLCDTVECFPIVSTFVPARFDQPDFDLVLEILEKERTFLSQYPDVIGMEGIHKAEKLYEDLCKMAVHYNQLQPEHRTKAEEHIENLCIYAEEFVYELKEKIDGNHLNQMAKLAYKHTK